MSSAYSFSATDLPNVPVVNGTDVLECFRLWGPEPAARLLAYGEAALKYANGCNSLASASIRSMSVASSTSSRTGTSGPAGLSGTRLESIRKVGSWRDKGDLNRQAPTPSRVPDGMCYMKLLNKNNVEQQCVRTGDWPTFGALTRLSARVFKDISELERFRLVQTCKDVYHVAAGGNKGVSFLDSVAMYGTRIKAQPGTFVRAVVDSGRKVERSGVFVSGHARIGGNGEWDLTRQTDRTTLIGKMSDYERFCRDRALEAYRAGDVPGAVAGFVADRLKNGEGTIMDRYILEAAATTLDEFDRAILGFYSGGYAKIAR